VETNVVQKDFGTNSSELHMLLQAWLEKVDPESTTHWKGNQQNVSKKIALHAFLLTKLKPSALERLSDDLGMQGYAGTPEMRLMERLIMVEDPARFVSDHIAKFHLLVEIGKLLGKAPSPDRSTYELAQDLLAALGFPVPIPVKGLAATVSAVNSAKSRLLIETTADCGGIVSELAKHLEYVCHIMIRFICQASLKHPAEPFLQRSGQLRSEEVLAKVTLGKLLDLLEFVGKETQRITTTGSVVLRFSIAQSASLVSLRNSFSHFNVNQAKKTRAENLADARRFILQAEGFVKQLSAEETRVFPRVIRVDQVVIDRWNRRITKAVDDTGQDEWIFTDEDLHAGAVYFMHPLTNPLRVDPILVPAGDLIWPLQT